MQQVMTSRVVEGIPEGLTFLCQIADLPSREERDKVLQLLLKLPQIELPLKHSFSVGVYVREIFMPAGSLVVGKLHATEHLNIISQGMVTVWSEQDGMKQYRGPWTFNSVAGTRKYLYTHTDTIWSTVHVTEETDLDKLEKALIISDPIVAETELCHGV